VAPDAASDSDPECGHNGHGVPPHGGLFGWYFDTTLRMGVRLDVALAASCPYLDLHT